MQSPKTHYTTYQIFCSRILSASLFPVFNFWAKSWPEKYFKRKRGGAYFYLRSSTRERLSSTILVLLKNKNQKNPSDKKIIVNFQYCQSPSVNETSEAVEGDPAVVKLSYDSHPSPAGAPHWKWQTPRGCKKRPPMRRGTKCYIGEDMFRSISYVDPRVPSQKG